MKMPDENERRGSKLTAVRRERCAPNFKLWKLPFFFGADICVVFIEKVWDCASPMGDNIEELKKHLPTRFDWIWYHNLDDDVNEAKRQLQAEGLIA
jgi:hypothetical protein